MNDRVRASDRIAVGRAQRAQQSLADTQQFVRQNEAAIGEDVAREVLRDREAATRVITQQTNEQLRATNSHIQTIPSAPADPTDRTSLIDRAVAQEQQRRETLAALGTPPVVPQPPAPPTQAPVPPPVVQQPPAPPANTGELGSGEPAPPSGSPTVASGAAPTGAGASPTAARTQAASQTASENANARSAPDTTVVAAAPTQVGPLQLSFEPNPHNQYDRVSYWFKLSMINDLDAEDPALLNKFLRNEIRQITVAESGVTTGFNLGDVSIQDVISSNFRNRSSLTTEISMQIFEPYSMTLPDRLFRASQELGVRNWRLAPMMLQLEFRYIKQTGEIYSPTGTEKLVKVYQIMILDFDAQLKETGTQYDVKAAVKGNLGFRDAYTIMPQSHRINTETPGSPPTTPPPAANPGLSGADGPDAGGTRTNAPRSGLRIPAANSVGAFFENLGKKITELYVENRAGNVGNSVSSVQLPVMIYKFWVEPELARQEINFTPENNSRRASFNSGNTSTGEITISRGISVSTLVDDILASLKNPNYFFTLPQDGGLVKIPVIECVTKNVGWDLLRNDYVREFNYIIRMKESNRPVPFQEFGQAVQASEQNQAARLQAIQKTLRKRYDYFYTGLNTEVINCDVKFNQLHIIPTPLLDVTPPVNLTDSSVVPPNAVTGDAVPASEVGTLASQESSRITARQTAISAIRNDPNADFGAAERITELNTEIQAAQEQLRKIGRQSVLVFENEQAARSSLTSIINTSAEAQRILTGISRISQENARRAGERLFAEDIDIKLEDNMLRLSYYADPRDIVNMMTRPTMVGTPAGNNDPSAATRPMVSSILSQIYDRGGQHLLELDLEIRGDPYWLGLTDTERNQELLAWMQTLQPGGVEPVATPTITNREAFVNRYDQDANILVKFRAGSPPDVNTGFQNLTDGSTFFYGVYTVIECTHEFKQGKFTQRLKAIRDMLINVSQLRAAERTATSTNQPRQVAPAQPAPGASANPAAPAAASNNATTTPSPAPVVGNADPPANTSNPPVNAYQRAREELVTEQLRSGNTWPRPTEEEVVNRMSATERQEYLAQEQRNITNRGRREAGLPPTAGSGG